MFDPVEKTKHVPIVLQATARAVDEKPVTPAQPAPSRESWSEIAELAVERKLEESMR